jgi:hypothetical protein
MPSRRRLGTLPLELQPPHTSPILIKNQGFSRRNEYQKREESLTSDEPGPKGPDGLSGEITLDGLHFQQIDGAPSGAIFRQATKICWINIDCGLWAELEGVSEVCELSSRITIAAIPTEARFHSLDGEICVCIQAGIWRISRPD